jgi:DNA-binding CsgD family transcriptional regulator
LGVPEVRADRSLNSGGWPNVERVLSDLADASFLTPVLKVRLIEVAQGLSYKEIADRHRISLNTVKTEVSAVLSRIGVTCRHEIQDTAAAAAHRFEAGATHDEVITFVRLRLE